jgi:ATP-dependent DNA helicase RecG
VDRIYEELLRLGKGMPGYEADESMVRLTLPTRTHPAFARFVATETREGRRLDLDELIALRVVTERGFLDRWTAAQRLQLSEEEAAARLVSLRERGYLAPQGRGRGTTYRLARHLSDILRGHAETDRELPLDSEAVRLRVEAILGERGTLTNAEVRRLSGFSRTEVLRLLRSMTAQGIAALQGRGRAAHYVPGPRIASAKAAPPKRK